MTAILKSALVLAVAATGFSFTAGAQAATVSADDFGRYCAEEDGTVVLVDNELKCEVAQKVRGPYKAPGSLAGGASSGWQTIYVYLPFPF